ncbi:NUDIX domain-containing protein [Solirubrobacter soli]|uniref:NUDIX domain-containing protein n=1 Tax=Solirubrobacter soli TaxID=363832 RepID=UPI00047FF71A|nr:NUDIX hydrolase [Solirubrobacter soli]
MRATSSRVVYENRWMRVHEDITELSDGSAGLYGWIEKRPGTVIVPVDDDGVWLVEQYRYLVGERMWEFPQGSFEDGEVAAEELARMELAEETGLRAGRMENLGRLFYAYGIANQPFHVWRATELTQGDMAPEPTEAGIVARRFPVAEVERMVDENVIQDAASIAAWHLVLRRP